MLFMLSRLLHGSPESSDVGEASALAATGGRELSRHSKASSRHEASETPAVEALVSDLHDKLPFHENRWMCLTESETATLRLGPVARLEVTIVKAKGLISRDRHRDEGEDEGPPEDPPGRHAEPEVVEPVQHAEQNVSDPARQAHWPFASQSCIPVRHLFESARRAERQVAESVRQAEQKVVESVRHAEQKVLESVRYAEQKVIASFSAPPPQPFVRVYVDDVKQFETTHVRDSRHPEWHSELELDITAARSMIRFHLYDLDVEDAEAQDLFKGNMQDITVADDKQNSLKHSLGFVEVCVGDVPFDTEIEGWLELRFPTHLQGTNATRYEQHCRRREDEMHEDVLWHMIVGEGSGTAAMQHGRAAGEKKRDGVFSLPSCGRLMRSMKERILQHGATSPDATGPPQFNAGELLVRMKLVRVGLSESDVIFSHALQPPALFFNNVLLEEDLPELDIQELLDDAMDIKYAVLDDFVFCFASYIWYLATWQSKRLSGLIAFFICASSWNHELTVMCLYAVATVLLLLNRQEGQRKSMTTSGLNAPLNNTGFKLVVRWRSIPQMEVFLYRVVLDRGGQLVSERELHEFVAKGLYKGASSLALEEVINVLGTMDWVTFDSKETKVKPGSLVRIHERRRGTVEKIIPSEAGTDRMRVVVHYDEIDREDQDHMETCYEDHLHVRTVLPKIPKVLLPGKLKQNIRKIGWQLDYGKKSMVLPMLRFISDVLTWKTPLLTTVLAVYLVFRATMTSMEYFFPGPFVNMSMWLLRNTSHIVLEVALCAFFTVFAQPLAWLLPLLRMLAGWRASRRQAPRLWAFFTPHPDPLALRLEAAPTEGCSSSLSSSSSSSPSRSSRALDSAACFFPIPCE